MTTGNHDVAFEELMALLDGELPAGRAERVRAHVRGCGACQRMESEMRNVSSRLGEWTVPDAPPALHWPQSSRKRWGVARWMPLAAGLVIVVGAGVLWSARQWLDRMPVRQAMQVSTGGAEPVPEEMNYQENLSRKNLSRVPMRSIEAMGSGPLLARTARLSLVPRDFDDARAATERIMAAAGGFTGRIAVSDPRRGERSLSATLQVPSAKLDEVLASLRQLGQVTEESQEGEDVTQQSVDLDARLSNARASEKRLQAILANRTGRLSDVLDVEREISRVREEIERMEASRQALDGRITYAIVSLAITEERKAAVDLGPMPATTRLRNAIVDGYTGAISGALAVALFLAHVGPTLVLWGIVVGLPAWFVKRRFAA